MKTKIDKSYWENKYKSKTTGWDIGEISTPLKTYIDQLENKQISILIPGAGNAYEAEYLWANGFTNVTIIDLTGHPLINFKQRVPDFPEEQLKCIDFFNFNGSFDLILEQTFFCALHPKLRKQYVSKMYELLSPKGKLAGLLFNFPLTKEGPPFGGSESEYLSLFSPNFKIKALNKSYNSIKPRENRELFFIFEKDL